MSGFLDANLVVRYVVRDPPELAALAAGVIDSEEGLLITEGVIAETAHVLTRLYGIPRSDVVDDLIDLVQKENISTFDLDKGVVVQGLLMCRPSGRVSFADAMLWAAARSSGNRVVYSLDRRFPQDGVEVRPGNI